MYNINRTQYINKVDYSILLTYSIHISIEIYYNIINAVLYCNVTSATGDGSTITINIIAARLHTEKSERFPSRFHRFCFQEYMLYIHYFY